MAKLSQVLRGIQSSQLELVRFPITPAILLRIKEAWEREGLNCDGGKVDALGSHATLFLRLLSVGRNMFTPTGTV